MLDKERRRRRHERALSIEAIAARFSGAIGTIVARLNNFQ